MWVIRGYFSWDKLLVESRPVFYICSRSNCFCAQTQIGCIICGRRWVHKALMSGFHFGPKFVQKKCLRSINFKFRCTVCKCQITQGLADIAEKVKSSRILQGFSVDRPLLPCNLCIPFFPLVCRSLASLTPDISVSSAAFTSES